MKRYHDEEGYFLYPSTVPDLGDVPESERCLYVKGSRGYELDADVREEVEAAQAEIARVKAELERTKREGQARLVRERKLTDDAQITAAIRQSLNAAGVAPRFHKAAAALVRESYRFETEERDDGGPRIVLAADDFGLHTTERAVERWLATNEAEPYQPRSATLSNGYFSTVLRQLREGR